MALGPRLHSATSRGTSVDEAGNPYLVAALVISVPAIFSVFMLAGEVESADEVCIAFPVIMFIILSLFIMMFFRKKGKAYKERDRDRLWLKSQMGIWLGAASIVLTLLIPCIIMALDDGGIEFILAAIPLSTLLVMIAMRGIMIHLEIRNMPLIGLAKYIEKKDSISVMLVINILIVAALFNFVRVDDSMRGSCTLIMMGPGITMILLILGYANAHMNINNEIREIRASNSQPWDPASWNDGRNERQRVPADGRAYGYAAPNNYAREASQAGDAPQERGREAAGPYRRQRELATTRTGEASKPAARTRERAAPSGARTRESARKRGGITVPSDARPGAQAPGKKREDLTPQIRKLGEWESMGLDMSGLRILAEKDPEEFARQFEMMKRQLEG